MTTLIVNNSVKRDENSDNKCYIINKDNFNIFDLNQNKIVHSLCYKKMLNNEMMNSIQNNLDLNELNSNPIKICSDFSNIDSNQV